MTDEAAYFISYDSETQATGFEILMDTLGAHRYGRTAWILRTKRVHENIWRDFMPFCNSNGTLFMVQIFPGSIACSVPRPFTHDPIKELLMGLDPYAGEE
jgi:hypothetical protein